MKSILVAAAVGLAVTLLGTPIAIRAFRVWGWGQRIREDGPHTHFEKMGTPTMGGIVMLIALAVSYAATRFTSGRPTASGLALVFAAAGFGLVGFADDFTKVRRRRSLGLSKSQKFLGTAVVSVLFGVIVAHYSDSSGTTTNLSFVRDTGLHLGVFFLLWCFLMLTASSNAVNLTDGLDGLAAGSTTLVLSAYVFIAFWQFRHPCGGVGVSDLGCYAVNARAMLDTAVVAAGMMGAVAGFLWWNAAPARIFMGDTGSLAIGGLLGALAITTNTQLLLVILGGLFVIETMSVILQVISFRGFHRRIFRMSPIHHHFELAGWPEFTGDRAVLDHRGVVRRRGARPVLRRLHRAWRPRLSERFDGARVLVVGAGVAGLAAATALQRQGADVRVTESRPAEEIANRGELRAMGVQVLAGGHEPAHLEGATLVVTGPGIPEHAPVLEWARDRGIPVWGEMELGARLCDVPYVAVTGTNGKTTVTGMVASCLRAAGLDAVACGNIGHAFPLAALEEHDALVVECSSFQLRLQTSLHPKVSVLLNLAPDHLDWHGSFEGYAASKASIYANQGADDVHVGSRDDPRAAAISSAAPCPVVWTSTRGPDEGEVGIVDGVVVSRVVGSEGSVGPVDADRAGFAADAAAAAAAALSFGVDADAVRAGLASFQPQAHRGEVVATVDGVPFIDNSKATNVHAAMAAIERVRHAVLIAGGRAKGVDLSPLAEAAPNLSAVVAIGEAAPELLALFEGIVPGIGSRLDRSRDGEGLRPRPDPRGSGAARAGLCQLGSVHRLRRARRSVRGRGAFAAGGGGPWGSVRRPGPSGRRRNARRSSALPPSGPNASAPRRAERRKARRRISS